MVEEGSEGYVELVEGSEALVTHDSPRLNPLRGPNVEGSSVSVSP